MITLLGMQHLFASLGFDVVGDSPFADGIAHRVAAEDVFAGGEGIVCLPRILLPLFPRSRAFSRRRLNAKPSSMSERSFMPLPSVYLLLQLV